MTSILLVIELTVVFYSTMIVWQAGTHQNAVSASGQNGLTGYRNAHGRASQRSKDPSRSCSSGVADIGTQPLLQAVPARASHSTFDTSAGCFPVQKAAGDRRRRSAAPSSPHRTGR